MKWSVILFPTFICDLSFVYKYIKQPPTHTIEDTLGEPVQGTFYEQELQSSVQEIYPIERVLKRGKDRVLVKWKV